MRFGARIGESVRKVELTRKEGGKLLATVDGRLYAVDLTEPQPFVYSMLVDGVSHEAIVQIRDGRCRVRLGSSVFEVVPDEPGGRRADLGGGEGSVRAVMPGRVLRVHVAPGDEVKQRQGLLVIEAMKMENEITAPRDGVIKEIKAEAGKAVETGDVLVVIE